MPICKNLHRPKKNLHGRRPWQIWGMGKISSWTLSDVMHVFLTQRKALNYTREDISGPNIYCLHYWVKLFWAIAQLIVDLMTERFKDRRSSRMQTRPPDDQIIDQPFLQNFLIKTRAKNIKHCSPGPQLFIAFYQPVWGDLGAKSWSNPNILFL